MKKKKANRRALRRRRPHEPPPEYRQTRMQSDSVAYCRKYRRWMNAELVDKRGCEDMVKQSRYGRRVCVHLSRIGVEIAL